MLDIPSITGIVAAIGVLVGVILTVMELRNLRAREEKRKLPSEGVSCGNFT